MLADNVTLPATGTTISTDDIGGGVEVQRVKVQYGADGTATDVAQATGLPVTSGYMEVSGSVAANNTAVISVDTAGYRWISVHVTTTISGFLLFQGSNDNTNWSNHYLGKPDSVTTDVTWFAGGGGGAGPGIWAGPLNTRYFRIMTNGWTSGTVSVVAGFSVDPGVIPGTALRIVGLNNSATGDAAALGYALTTAGLPFVYNGSSFDRARSVGTAKGTTGLGVPAAGIVGFDGTNYQAVKVDSGGVQAVSPVPSTTGTGWTPFNNTALVHTATVVKSGAGTLGGYMLQNPAAATTFLQVFDNAAPTVGTTAPTYVIAVPASGTRDVEFSCGIAHASAITVAATTTATGLTSPATGLVTTILYK